VRYAGRAPGSQGAGRDRALPVSSEGKTAWGLHAEAMALHRAVGNRAFGRLAQAGAADQASLSRLSRADSVVVSRLVGRAGCAANVAGAPDDPRAELEDIDSQAHDMAAQLADDFATDAATVHAGGVPDTPSASLQAYITRFGLPVAAGRGFMNRITGTVVATQDAATVQELQILSRRFRLVARLFSEPVNYICGDGQVDLGGCVGTCDPTAGAFTCRGQSSIAICDLLWHLDRIAGLSNDNRARAANIVHESFHMIWGLSSPRGVGEIGDNTLRGAGRNFDVAGCYQAILDDVFDANSGGTGQCPDIPTP
jgi:hypothetical protein